MKLKIALLMAVLGSGCARGIVEPDPRVCVKVTRFYEGEYLDHFEWWYDTAFLPPQSAVWQGRCGR